MNRNLYNQYIEKLTEEAKTGKVRENTIKSFRADLNTLYNYLEKKEVKTEEEYFKVVTEDDIKYMIEDFKQEYKPSTLNRKIINIRTYFKYVIETTDWLDVNYLKHIKLYGEDVLEDTTKEKDILSIQEVKQLLKQTRTKTNEKDRSFEFNSKRNKAILTILTCYGNRIEEVLSSKFSDIKEIEGYQYIDIVKRRVKNKMHKRVFISNEIKKTLDDYLEVRNTILPSNNDDYIFTSISGKKLNNNYINDALSVLCKKADINKHITCHCFRSICTLALQDKFIPSYLIDEIVGWKNSGDMQTRYSNHLPKNKIEQIISATNLL